MATYSREVFTRPPELSDRMVTDAVSQGWGLDVDGVEYAALGFGSHHWRASNRTSQWFITVDDLDMKIRDDGYSRHAAMQRLHATLTVAANLEASGYRFVVGPIRSEDERVLEPIDSRFVCAVYPHIEGETGEWGGYQNTDERSAVVDVLVALHSAPREHMSDLPADDYAISSRSSLEAACHDLGSIWSTGPFAERTRSLLAQHQHELTAVLSMYDSLVASHSTRGAAKVVTHGEPHRGNVIITSDGLRLIDWDTALLAPVERDLWSLILEEPAMRARYESQSGRTLNDELLALYQLRWDLCDIALFVDEFHRPHTRTEDTAAAWTGLQQHLNPTRWAGLAPGDTHL